MCMHKHIHTCIYTYMCLIVCLCMCVCARSNFCFFFNISPIIIANPLRIQRFKDMLFKNFEIFSFAFGPKDFSYEILICKL